LKAWRVQARILTAFWNCLECLWSIFFSDMMEKRISGIDFAEEDICKVCKPDVLPFHLVVFSSVAKGSKFICYLS
jgi:hypothetical protein